MKLAQKSKNVFKPLWKCIYLKIHRHSLSVCSTFQRGLGSTHVTSPRKWHRGVPYSADQQPRMRRRLSDSGLLLCSRLAQQLRGSWRPSFITTISPFTYNYFTTSSRLLWLILCCKNIIPYYTELVFLSDLLFCKYIFPKKRQITNEIINKINQCQISATNSKLYRGSSILYSLQRVVSRIYEKYKFVSRKIINQQIINGLLFDFNSFMFRWLSLYLAKIGESFNKLNVQSI